MDYQTSNEESFEKKSFAHGENPMVEMSEVN